MKWWAWLLIAWGSVLFLFGILYIWWIYNLGRKVDRLLKRLGLKRYKL
jgi:hypothetical protein